MKKEWIIKQCSDDKKSVLEKLLEQRGIIKPKDIKEYLNPNEFKAISPYAFCDMKKSVERIKQAIFKDEKILIYGDFDADGITSTSLLIKTFRHLGADVDYFIPDREKQGHGLNFYALVKIMPKRKPKLIITVDCGVSNIKEVQQLKAFGIDTIITDHHEAKEEMPDAVGIINPKAPYKLDEKLSTKEIVSLTSLAGVGVAFKLATALLAEYDKSDFVLELLPLVAVGTISDIVPLVYENRLLVTKGLDLISKGRHFGIKRLLEEAGYKIDKNVTSDQIAFGVTPRINATGRLDNVDDSVKVLISDNVQEIELSIMTLNECNKIRQKLCDDIFEEAKEMKQGANSIILFNKEWHIGIIGIVASRLVEAFNKPTFLMTYSDETKQIRCSSRSVEGVNVFDVLSANADFFDNFGGHAMAGGFAFNPENHTFEEVKKALDTTINEVLGGKKLSPVLHVDLELQPDDINFELISDVEKLQPFGAENPRPRFMMRNLKLLQKKLLGANKNHLKLSVQDISGNTYDCLWWSRGDISLTSGHALDMVFSPELNTFNGNTTLQFIVEDIHSEHFIEENNSEYKIHDHRKKTGIFTSIEDYLKTAKLNIGVFAEDKNVVEILKEYPQIYTRIFTRVSATELDAIMFFDYPSSQELFSEILNKTSAKILHFMKYEQKAFDEKEFIKTISGMIKYSLNHFGGKFNIKNAAAKLALSEEVVSETLNALESVGVIEITDRNDEEFEILSGNDKYSQILHSELYSQILTEIKIVQDYKVSFSNADLNYFCNIS